MAKTHICTGGSEAQAANLTRYYNFGSGELEQGNSSEVIEYFTIQTAGTFSNAYIRVSANANTANSTMVFRKNTADGNQTVTITASTTGDFEDTTNTDAVVAGDEISWKIVTGNGTGTTTINVIAGVFDSTNATQTFSTVWANFTPISTTYVLSLYDPEQQTTSAENRTYVNFATAGTLENLYVYVTSNSRTDTTTVGSRINTSNGAVGVTIAAAATGIFEDTTNQDTVAAGDLVNLYIINNGGANGIGTRTVKIEFNTTNRSFVLGGMSALGGSNGNVAYAPPNFSSQGGITTGNTEANFQTDANFDFTASDLWLYCSSYSSGAITAVLRVNGSDTGLTIAANATGEFIDATNEVDVLSTDEINYKLSWSGTATSRGLSMLGTTDAPGFGILNVNGLAWSSLLTINGLDTSLIQSKNGLS